MERTGPASKDVAVSGLGLLVIDEEQRLDVGIKSAVFERMRKDVDEISLSGQLRCRGTLHMSLVRLRDMSIIEKPPASGWRVADRGRAVQEN